MIPTLRLKYVLVTQYVTLAVTALLFIGICTVLLLTNVATPALAISPLTENPQAGSPEDPRQESTTHLAGVDQQVTVTVTNSTDAFTEGQTLEDRSAFPLQDASAPVVTASGDGQGVSIDTIDVRITYTASVTGDAGGRFYRNEETIATDSVDGASGTLETVVDVGAVFERKDDLETEFGSGVTVTPTIQSIVTYQYPSGGERARTSTVSVGGEVVSTGALYSLPSGSNQQRHESESPERDSTSSLVNSAVGAVGVGFVLLLGTTLFLGRRGDRTNLARRIRAKRYSEWVTEIESYTPSGEPTVVQVHNMAGLVNLAIDIHERVLYTPRLEEYIVIDGDTMYKYRSDDSDKDGGSEFFGLSDAEMIPDVPEFDENGNTVTTPSADEGDAYSTDKRDAGTDSDTDAE